MRKFLIFACLFGLAAPTLAETVPLDRPAECQPVMTVQFRDCRVMTASHCGTDHGKFIRLENYGADGMTYISHETSEGGAISVLDSEGTQYVYNQALSRSTPPSTMLRDGHGQVMQVGQVFGNAPPYPFGETFEFKRSGSIDVSGGRLESFDMAGTLDYGGLTGTAEGKAYYHNEIGILFEGDGVTLFGDEEPYVHRDVPATIIRPGEPGFDSDLPSIDCIVVSLNSEQEMSVRA